MKKGIYYFLLVLAGLSLYCMGCNSNPAPTPATPDNDTAVEKPVVTDSSVAVVDFRATGNEPFWLLEIGLQGKMKFLLLGGDSLQVPTPKAIPMKDSLATSYQVQTNNGLLNVMVYDKICINDMSGDTLPKTVEVRLGDKKYKGCGRFLRAE